MQINTLTNTKDRKIAQFVELISQGIESWVKAGRIVAEAVDDDPDWIEKACDAVPGLQYETVRQFERIGRGHIEPRLLLSNTPGSRRLLGLPIEQQQRFLKDPVPVLIKTDAGWETLKTPIDNLTAFQASQVFGDRKVRTEAEQRAWLESKATVRAAAQIDEPYRVSGRKLIIFQACQLSAKQLAQLLAQME